MNEKIEKIVIESLVEIYENYETLATAKPNSKTQIFGKDGILDSLALVALVAEIETRLDDELQIQIVLANEQAMSRRNSPFKNVENLKNYILEIL